MKAEDAIAGLKSLEKILDEAIGILGETEGLTLWRSRIGGLLSAENEPYRIAIAGTVKSGKTTLVNALIGDDLLKRGAGIITSIVTRVRSGKELKASIQLKGWDEVNREATDAALFITTDEETEAVDLRTKKSRKALKSMLDGLGENALSDTGSHEKHVALISAMLDGIARVEPLIGEDGQLLEFDRQRFGEHRDFAGSDALAAYVDDLSLEVPGLGFGDSCELADCQGYDSPNPRHREKVQEYLLGCHQVVYVISSRIGVRLADLRFMRDLGSMGLLDATRIFMNVDLAEHVEAGELSAMKARIEAELKPFGKLEITVGSALKALMETLKENGEKLTRREELLLELWNEAEVDGMSDFGEFRDELAKTPVRNRKREVAKLAKSTLARAVGSTRTTVNAALMVARDQGEGLKEGNESLTRATELLDRSAHNFSVTLKSGARDIKGDLFTDINKVFHPSSGSLSAEVVGHVEAISPSKASLQGTDAKKLFSQLTHLQQLMREEFNSYKVEVVNAKAVEHIRDIWQRSRDRLSDAAEDGAELLLEAAEGYRTMAGNLGVEVEELELPELDGDIGKRTIPLFSAVTSPSADMTAQRVISFAGHWSMKIATGWTSRLFGRKEKGGFVDSLLEEGFEAAREQLTDEARSCFLNYNENLKHQVLGRNLDDLAQVWADSYGETAMALKVDLDGLRKAVGVTGEETDEMTAHLERLVEELESFEV